MTERDEAIVDLFKCVLDAAGKYALRACKECAKTDGADAGEISERLAVQRELNDDWRDEVEQLLVRVLKQQDAPQRLQ
jgi:uncharacterized membrane protein